METWAGIFIHRGLVCAGSCPQGPEGRMGFQARSEVYLGITDAFVPSETQAVQTEKNKNSGLSTAIAPPSEL